MYESQSFRSARSPTRNFQCLVGSSSRAWKRWLLLVRSMYRKNFRIVVPSSTSSCSNALICVVAARPDVLRHEVVDADDEDVLVVGPVEDRDLALARRPLVDPPEVVVGQLDRRRAPSTR